MPRNALQHNLGMLWHASIVYTIGSPQNPMVRQTFEVPRASVKFTISTEGQTSISYWAVDNAGNVAPMHAFTVTINKSRRSVVTQFHL